MKTCINCNKEFEDGLTACPHCGAAVPEQAEGTFTKGAQIPIKKKKKKNNALSIVIAVVLVIAGIGIRYYNSHAHKFKQTVELSDNENPSEEFADIFENNGLDIPNSLSGYPDLGSVAYADEDEEGWIYLMEYGIKGDTIVTLFDTVYIPVAGASDSDIEEYKTQMREYNSDVEKLDFATITYETIGEYLKISIHLDNIDKWENIKAAAATEMYADDVSGEEFYYSIETTEDDFLSQGYVKK